MNVIDRENAKQAAYVAKLAEAEALPHQPPEYRALVRATRNDLQGSPAQITVGAVAYNAVSKKARLETLDLAGEITGSVLFDTDCVEHFAAALRTLLTEEAQ
jgi:hypothetical protein